MIIILEVLKCKCWYFPFTELMSWSNPKKSNDLECCSCLGTIFPDCSSNPSTCFFNCKRNSEDHEVDYFLRGGNKENYDRKSIYQETWYQEWYCPYPGEDSCVWFQCCTCWFPCCAGNCCMCFTKTWFCNVLACGGSFPEFKCRRDCNCFKKIKERRAERKAKEKGKKEKKEFEKRQEQEIINGAPLTITETSVNSVIADGEERPPPPYHP